MQIFRPASFLDPSLAMREIEAEFEKLWGAVGGGGGISFSQISGNIAVGQMASGSNASASTYWRGDGAWAAPVGGGGTPGGANTNVQFNSSSAFGGDSGFTYAGGGQATLNFGTVTANVKALNITGTWNNAGVTFDAPFFMNITRTANNVSSKLMDLQVDSSTTVFSVDNGGQVVAFSNITTLNGSIIVPTAGSFQWAGNASFISDGIGIIGQRSGSSAQTFRVYNAYTDPSNYERGVFGWQTTPNVLTIGAQSAGTGTFRPTVIIAWTKAGAPVAADIPAGTFAVIRDTSGSTTKLYYNNAGTLQSVALA
jgi:hypothetical protein